MLPLIDNPYVQAGLWLVCVAMLSWLAYRSSKPLRQQLRLQHKLIDLINQQLPQTQCGQCGHAGCLPYARAIAQGEAINKCPPGGESTIRHLAALLNEVDETVDPAHGRPSVATIAVIREPECIGCTKCIQACPVDAILGAAKLMHSVIVDECTGCDLCVAPCPVDCIDMKPLSGPGTSPVWSQAC